VINPIRLRHADTPLAREPYAPFVNRYETPIVVLASRAWAPTRSERPASAPVQAFRGFLALRRDGLGVCVPAARPTSIRPWGPIRTSIKGKAKPVPQATSSTTGRPKYSPTSLVGRSYVGRRGGKRPKVVSVRGAAHDVLDLIVVRAPLW
jgi:hypothetical protein